MSAADKNIIAAINTSFDTTVPENISLKELRVIMAGYFNMLIQNDFNKLVSLLYRIDVNETLLKATLKQNPEADAGMIIAELVIERQIQKLHSKQSFTKRNDKINEEDKW